MSRFDPPPDDLIVQFAKIWQTPSARATFAESKPFSAQNSSDWMVPGLMVVGGLEAYPTSGRQVPSKRLEKTGKLALRGIFSLLFYVAFAATILAAICLAQQGMIMDDNLWTVRYRSTLSASAGLNPRTGLRQVVQGAQDFFRGHLILDHEKLGNFD